MQYSISHRIILLKLIPIEITVYKTFIKLSKNITIVNINFLFNLFFLHFFINLNVFIINFVIFLN